MPLWFFMLLLAPVIGSFLGLVVQREAKGEGWIWGRSACSHCGGTIAARDLVPIVSFVLLRGRCRNCKTRIGWFYPAAELASLGIASWAVAVSGGALLVASCVLGWLLLALAYADVACYRLPDVLTLPLLLIGLGFTLLLQPDAASDHAAAAAIGYLLFRLVAAGYRRLRGVAGLGAGDAKLMAALGAWLGVAAIPTILLVAAGAGLAAALLLRFAGRPIDATTRLPFGPFLAAAGWGLWLVALPNVSKLSPYLAGILK